MPVLSLLGLFYPTQNPWDSNLGMLEGCGYYWTGLVIIAAIDRIGTRQVTGGHVAKLAQGK